MMRTMRQFKDLGIEGITARWYNNNTKKHRMPEMRGYAKEVSAYAKNGSSILEIAPGPGYLSIELAKLGQYKIVGVDISKDFVEIARKNAKEAGVDVEFHQGNAAGLPFSDDMFQFIICTAAFKNFKEPLKALQEMHRVLKPGGTALIVDMNRNISDQEIESLTTNMGVKGGEALFMKLTFKHFLRKGAYSKDEFNNLISKTEFKEYDIKESGVGFQIYLRK
jgi:ubiquinone/menaquinone biosynthesis C-methylase UbiE